MLCKCVDVPEKSVEAKNRVPRRRKKCSSVAFEVVEVVKEFVTSLPRRDPVMTRGREGNAHGILVGMAVCRFDWIKSSIYLSFCTAIEPRNINVCAKK